MSLFSKNTLNTLIAVLYITNLTTSAMKYEQLQLQNPTKHNEPTQVDCSIMIYAMPRNRTVAYTFEKAHTDLFNYNNIQSTIKDPIIYLGLSDNNSNNKCYITLPAKQCFNLTNNSVLQIYEIKEDIFSKKGIYKPFLINAVCETNPKLEGNSFAEQFSNAMKKFYTDPTVQIYERNQTELEDAGIIKINREEKSDYPNIKGTYSNPEIIDNCEYNPHWKRILGSTNQFQMYYVEVVENLVAHGKNSISSEQDLIKSIFNEKTRTDKNRFTTLMGRQITGKY